MSVVDITHSYGGHVRMTRMMQKNARVSGGVSRIQRPMRNKKDHFSGALCNNSSTGMSTDKIKNSYMHMQLNNPKQQTIQRKTRGVHPMGNEAQCCIDISGTGNKNPGSTNK